jgi:hypothetical protein
MPQLLPDGLPDRVGRSRFDFTEYADGQAWKFVRGEDYTSSTETFRYNVRRWAKAHGHAVTMCPLPATDKHGRALPFSAAEPIGLAVQFDHVSSPPADSRSAVAS